MSFSFQTELKWPNCHYEKSSIHFLFLISCGQKKASRRQSSRSQDKKFIQEEEIISQYLSVHCMSGPGFGVGRILISVLWSLLWPAQSYKTWSSSEWIWGPWRIYWWPWYRTTIILEMLYQVTVALLADHRPDPDTHRLV